MILLIADDGCIYSMAPGDSLYFEYLATASGNEGRVDLTLERTDETKRCLITLSENKASEFYFRLVACLEAGKQDNTLLVDLEGLRTLAEGEE